MNIIDHNPTQSRFELTLEGYRCVLDYALHESVMTITHTGVPNELGGRGLAAELTQFALNYARAQGWKIVPQCSYAEVYIRKHPEYAPLVSNQGLI